ncbi:hypothetical protein DRJ16_00065 [Candidatus Woesearchaeota archaeon]|nr:MAG: hypothetical protein DRJ16_00065 [Candidatus Woesearchaeota archaeon]
MLTNKRIDLILTRIDDCKFKCWSNPNMKNVQMYFAALYTLFDNIFSLFCDEKIEILTKDLSEYFSTFGEINPETVDMKTVFKLIKICDRFNRHMRGLLQSKKYFFRTDYEAVKGIEKAFEILDKGGGFLGEFQGMDEE